MTFEAKCKTGYDALTKSQNPKTPRPQNPKTPNLLHVIFPAFFKK
jgi:hypothetical protein